jgi:hypothetical protein
MNKRHRVLAFIAPALVGVGLALTASAVQGDPCMKTADNAQTAEAPIACNPGAFTAEERGKWQALGKRLIAENRGRRELADGYAFEFDRTPETLREVAEFVEFESRCCPFVDFTVRVPSSGRGVVLEMTGRKGVKEMLAAELGLDQ